MLTAPQLQAILTKLTDARCALYLPHLNAAMQAYGVDTPMRTAAFVAQLAHESGEFRWMEEIWGPTPAQRRYEPPSDLAKRLGNTQPGDGLRFKGRGPIQITGRFNYRKYGDLLGIDLAAEPALAATPAIAFATAGLYWQRNGLNELADTGQFITITKRINGGLNGLEDRQRYHERAQAVLLAGPASRASAKRAVPLGRGHEAIVAASGRRVAARKTAASKPPAERAATSRPAVKKSTR